MLNTVFMFMQQQLTLSLTKSVLIKIIRQDQYNNM